MATELLTTAQVADEMGRSQQWVQSLISRGKLKAEQFGSLYLVRRSVVENYVHQPPGRPPTKKSKRIPARRNGAKGKTAGKARK